jgi:hypothetical protein
LPFQFSCCCCGRSPIRASCSHRHHRRRVRETSRQARSSERARHNRGRESGAGAKQTLRKCHTRWKRDPRHRNTPNQTHLRHGRQAFRPKLNIAFTDYSHPRCIIRSTFGRDIREVALGTGTMTFWQNLRFCAVALREFVAPTYRPERHYMRGPGPACARRLGTAEARF